MTLSIMEDHDTFKTALTDYQAALGDIPKILERYLGYVARTGKPLFSWDMISSLILKKFENVCDNYVAEKSAPCVRISADNGSTEDLKIECLKSLNEFSGVPFTIQRICELLLSPRQNYSKLDKFLRGFIRVVKVVTTVDRVGQRITTESQLLANAMSPFQMNETGDNWADFSNHCDESGGNINTNSPTSDIICGTESKNKCDLEYDDTKSIEDSMCIMPDTLTSYPSTNNIIQPPESSSSINQNMYENDSSYFTEQKTIAMPPIGALFKPIDQLEAFVQNVSSQVESSTVDGSIDGTKKRAADNDGLLESVGAYVGSPAKKSRIECLEEEEEEEEEDEVVATSSDSIGEQRRKLADEYQSVLCDIEVADTESRPSRSCETIVCAEEASSTNQEVDDDCDMNSRSTVSLSSSTMVDGDIGASQDASDGIEESNAIGTSEYDHDTGMVEPDQSNCDNEEDDGEDDEDEGGVEEGNGEFDACKVDGDCK